MGLDDEGELAKEVRAAQGVVAVRVAQVRGPAVVDRDAAVARDDADALDGLTPVLSMEAFDGEGSSCRRPQRVMRSVHSCTRMVASIHWTARQASLSSPGPARCPWWFERPSRGKGCAAGPAQSAVLVRAGYSQTFPLRSSR